MYEPQKHFFMPALVKTLFLFKPLPLVLIALVSCLLSQQALSNTHTLKSILVLGDSISAAYGIKQEEGWVALLNKKLEAEKSHYQAINASVSGNTSSDGLGRLQALLKQHQPEIVIVELGGNDGLRGYPIKLMERNLERIIRLSQESGAKVLLAGIEIPPNYGQRYTRAFRQGFINVNDRINKAVLTDKEEIAFLPFILKEIGTNPQLMQKDGIHPTAEAQIMILNNVWPYLKPLL